MRGFKAHQVAFNLNLFKRLRFYHIFNPSSQKLFDHNVYGLVLVAIIAVQSGINVYGMMGFLVRMEDSTDDIGLLQILFAYMNYYLSAFKICICMYNAEKIWELLDVTRIDFITSRQCSKYITILHKYRDLSIKITNFLSVFITITVFGWWMFPLTFNKLVAPPADAGTVRYENVVNMRFPLTIDTYNDYFWISYVIEVALGIMIEYGILITDNLLISISCVLIAQYEIHAKACANIGHEQNIAIGNINDCNEHYEDIKSIIFDQQNLDKKLKIYYAIVWPIIILTVVVTSGSIIILSYSFVVIFMSEEPMPFLSVFKLSNTFFFLCAELFIHCYLFEIIQIKREAVNFGIYCCNWTAMDLKFNKLVLLTMRLNDANKQTIKITEANVINLLLFSDVIVTCYNIVSIMLRTRMSK